jgi:serine/threonine protein phosphatase PrpC
MIGITRALGDHMMKDLLISTPHFHATELQADDELLVLACDGVSDLI